MTMKVSCKELGIEGCDYSAKGKTAGDVVEKMVEHLHDQHDIRMPDAEVIMQGEVIEDPIDVIEPDTALVVQRLKETLNIEPPEGPDMPIPPAAIGRPPTR